MIRKAREAKEAAKDRIRSVRHHHHHRGPHPARPSTKPPPQRSGGFPTVSMKQVDDAFTAVLDDESDFSNPFCDPQPPPSLPVAVAESNQHTPIDSTDDHEDLFSDPPAIRARDDDIFDSDLFPSATAGNVDPLLEQSVENPSQEKVHLLEEQHEAVDELAGSERNDLFDDSSPNDVNAGGVSAITDGTTDTVSQEVFQDTIIPQPDQSVSSVQDGVIEVSAENSLPSADHDSNSPVSRHEDEPSSVEIPLVESVPASTNLPSNSLDDHSDDLFPDDVLVETGNHHSEPEDHIVITQPHEDLPNIYPPLPSIDDLNQGGLAVPSKYNPNDYLFEESPLSSLPSSYENEPVLASYDSELVESLPEKRVDEIRQRDDLNESSGSIEADLDMLLAPKVPDKEKEVQKSNQTTSGVQRERGSHPNLDSGVFETETGMTPTPERDFKEDSLLMSEDHFKNSPPVQRHLKRNDTPPKRNSQGKFAPPRPSVSPKMKQRLFNVKETTSEDKEDVRIKIVQPLGSARPEPIASRDSIGGTITQTVEANLKKDRVPADDLFREDQVVKLKTDEVSLQADTQAATQVQAETQAASAEPRYLPLWLHITLAGCLYLYYSLNIFPYLAGFFAGVLLVYLLVGCVFIYYVQNEEKAKAKNALLKDQVQLSDDFVKHMKVKFEDLHFYHGTKFTSTFTYDPATHHPSQRQKTILKLSQDFSLYIHVHEPAIGDVLKKTVNIRNCKISLVPQEVAKNRKRRWSKKFPIHITNEKIKLSVYVFSPHARDKEDWFRRMKSASLGFRAEQLIKERKEFFKYMQHYFDLDTLYEDGPPAKALPRRNSKRSSQSSSTSSVHAQRKPAKVSFSKGNDNDEENPQSNLISFTKGSPQIQHRKQPLTSSSSSGSLKGTSVDPPQSSTSPAPSLDDGFEVVPRPHVRLPRATLWINAVAARLCWDVWHEKRWKDWVMSRIQKKLIRVKTPSFIDQLRLTDVNLGNDMPVVKGLNHGPVLNLRGIWVYLDVVYEGSFVMTIETKMRLGAKDEGKAEGAQQMTEMSKQHPKFPMSSPHQPVSAGKVGSMSHSNAARALGSSVDPEEIDSGSDDEDTQPSSVVHPLEKSTTESNQKHEASDGAISQGAIPSSSSAKERRFKLMYSYAKAGATMITKRVANTKIVRRAAEKVSSYPLTLTVDVRRLNGVLAVNVPPPPSDTIWYGFEGSPKLELVAKPKLGHREVTYSRVTHWIERKLCELVNKKLVLPEMEDLSISILNSGMPDLDVLKPIGTDTETTNS